MKVGIIQPPYSAKFEDAQQNFEWELAALAACDPSLDVIVLPESCDVPAFAGSAQNVKIAAERYREPLKAAVRETAVRCHALVFFNVSEPYGADGKPRNSTLAMTPAGEIAARYDKRHLTPSEGSGGFLDSAYTFDPIFPEIFEYDGVRYAFLTCYDFYFYEAFSAIARTRPDVIIGCSHQRTDRQDALSMMTRFCAYNCNAWVLRASVSMGEDAQIGGQSMIAAPDGTAPLEMFSRVGMETLEIDPHQKYRKAPGFFAGQTGERISHFDYTERGRRPWQYRPAGPAICRTDEKMPYPRVCAHRGFNTVAPENSLPAFGAAVALGAEEIEFDLWQTRDGEIVSTHDARVDRTSNGTGLVYEHTYAELAALDFGSRRGTAFSGLRIVRFEEILQKFACHTVMNIHIKTPDNDHPIDEAHLRRIITLIDRYDCRKWVYFMCGNEAVLAQLRALAPDITRCAGAGGNGWDVVDKALRQGCRKVQFFKHSSGVEDFDEALVARAHENGLICNVFYADTPADARRYLAMGIDAILTNDYWNIAQTVADYPKK